jgi:hypothetical protein
MFNCQKEAVEQQRAEKSAFRQDDVEIRKMEKLLNLNKRKNKSQYPLGFRNDGLDCILSKKYLYCYFRFQRKFMVGVKLLLKVRINIFILSLCHGFLYANTTTFYLTSFF